MKWLPGVDPVIARNSGRNSCTTLKPTCSGRHREDHTHTHPCMRMNTHTRARKHTHTPRSSALQAKSVLQSCWKAHAAVSRLASGPSGAAADCAQPPAPCPRLGNHLGPQTMGRCAQETSLKQAIAAAALLGAQEAYADYCCHVFECEPRLRLPFASHSAPGGTTEKGHAMPRCSHLQEGLITPDPSRFARSSSPPAKRLVENRARWLE